MSFRDYLHEKAEESRHNETMAYLMFLAGAVFFVGGVLTTLSLPEDPNWFLIIPYYVNASAQSYLSLALLVTGIVFLVSGIALGLAFANSRGWYMEELKKANDAGEFKQKPSLKTLQKKKE